MSDEILGLDCALDALGFDLEGPPVVEQTPAVDVRFDTLVALIERLLRSGNEFRNEERLIVFTEYKTTLDYLVRRLRERYPADRVLTLFGAGGPEGMTEIDRDNVKAAFNDPESSVRVLVATDAASEGLNLHHTARYLLHYDCPWNPSRLEQRNGRVDRYGQARDVTVHHFVSDTDPDLQFLAHVIGKVDEIREDLGSVNEVLDRAVHRRLIEGEDEPAVRRDMDNGIDAARGNALFPADATASLNGASGELEALAAEIDLDPEALGYTLEAAHGDLRRQAAAPGRRGARLLPRGEPFSPRVAGSHRRRRTLPRARRRNGSDATTGLQHRSLHRAAWTRWTSSFPVAMPCSCTWRIR